MGGRSPLRESFLVSELCPRAAAAARGAPDRCGAGERLGVPAERGVPAIIRLRRDPGALLEPSACDSLPEHGDAAQGND